MINSEYLKETYFFDHSHSQIQKLVEDFRGLSSVQEQIEAVYLHIRDQWRYDPFDIGLTPAHFKASHIVARSKGHCIDKSILYITALRALEIPARLRLAKVKNHIAVESLVDKLGTNAIAPHGLAEVYFQNQWTKCSPAFNKELCARYNVGVLDFNGTEDSIFQEYNNEELKFMDYVEDYGSFPDIPFEFIVETFKSNYSKLYERFKDDQEINLRN